MHGNPSATLGKDAHSLSHDALWQVSQLCVLHASFYTCVRVCACVWESKHFHCGNNLSHYNTQNEDEHILQPAKD